MSEQTELVVWQRAQGEDRQGCPPEDDPDPMMLVATQKAMDVVKKALETQVERLRQLSQNPSLPLDSRLKLRQQLPPLLQAAEAVREEAVSA